MLHLFLPWIILSHVWICFGKLKKKNISGIKLKGSKDYHDLGDCKAKQDKSGISVNVVLQSHQ